MAVDCDMHHKCMFQGGVGCEREEKRLGWGCLFPWRGQGGWDDEPAYRKRSSQTKKQLGLRVKVGKDLGRF